MTNIEIQDKVNAFPFWYHKIELPYGIVTPGVAPISEESYRIPKDLAGKRVLDIGAWDGFWTFEALKRGAVEAVAIDDFSPYRHLMNEDERKGWDTFDFCRSVLGYNNEECKRMEMSVYDISEERLGRFDVIFFFGTLYHLRYPLLALDKIAAMCDQELFVESAILDDYSPYRGGFGHGYSGSQIVMEFYPDDQYGGDKSNCWSPTLHCLMSMVHSTGDYRDINGWKLADEPTSLNMCRGFVHAVKK